MKTQKTMKTGSATVARDCIIRAQSSGTAIGAALAQCDGLRELLYRAAERERSRKRREYARVVGSERIKPLRLS